MRHIASRTSPGQPLLVSAGRRMKKLRTLAVQPRYPAHAPATGVWSNTLNLLRSDGREQGAARLILCVSRIPSTVLTSRVALAAVGS
jgi:hypothetical protein